MAEVTRSTIVKSDVDTAYRVWSNFENFPMFMKYIKSVSKSGNGRSHWEVSGPLGKTVDWEAELTRLEPNKMIAWSTKDNKGDVTTSGEVTFTSLAMNETQVTVIFHYEPKGGTAGDIVAAMFAKPGDKLEEDLGNFKYYIEGMNKRA
jgi:uncharacterized membrane protein